jgi:hypothetical protein
MSFKPPAKGRFAGVGLGGATRKEKTAETLLNDVKREREARSIAKHRIRAATIIQVRSQANTEMLV